MKGVNKVILLGNLGKDPDIQFLEKNVAVAKLSLATTENYKDKNGKPVAQTEWHSVILWRGLAEVAQKYLRKGSLIYVEGKLKSRSWDDRDHIRRTATEIIGDQLVLLDKQTEQTP